MSVYERAVSRRALLRMVGLGGAAAFVAGCAPAAAPAVGTAAPAGSPVAKSVTISFGPYGAASDMKLYGVIIDEFEKKYPNIKVDRRFDTAMDIPKIMNQLRSGTAADLCRTDDDSVHMLAMAGVLLILDDYVKRDLNMADYFDFTWKRRTGPGGEIACVLIGGGTGGSFYNIDHFNEAGIQVPTSHVTGNWTLDQFEANCRKLVKKTGDKIERYAAFFNQSFGYNFFPNRGLKPYNDDETKSTVNSPEAVALFDRLQKWHTVDKWAVPPGEQPLALFNSGRLSIYNVWGATATQIDPKINWDVCPWPEDVVKPAFVHGGDFCLPIYARTKYPEETWQLAKWFMGEYAQTQIAKVDVMVPSLLKVAEGPAFMDQSRPPKRRNIWFESRKYVWPVPNNPMGEVYSDTMSGNVTQLQSGSKTAAQFLADQEKLLDAEIKNDNWSKKLDVRGGRLPGIPEKTGYPGTINATSPYK